MSSRRSSGKIGLYRIGLALLFCLGSRTAAAQQEVPPFEFNDVSPQLWLDYVPSVFLKENLELYGDIGVRWEIESSGWWRLVVRPGLRSCLGNGICFMGGVGSFFTFNEIVPDTWEIRPFQGASTTWPNWRFLPLNHLVRLEERFDFNTANWASNISLRLRYRLGSFLKWEAPLQPGRYWRLIGNVEGFLKLAGDQGQFQEQVRATVGLERSYRLGFRLRAEITWQKRGLFFVSDESVSDIFLRIHVVQGWGQ